MKVWRLETDPSLCKNHAVVGVSERIAHVMQSKFYVVKISNMWYYFYYIE